VSNGHLSCIGVLDGNPVSNTENTFIGEGLSEGLQSRERKLLLVILRNYLLDKGYIPDVVLGWRGSCLDGRESIGEVDRWCVEALDRNYNSSRWTTWHNNSVLLNQCKDALNIICAWVDCVSVQVMVMDTYMLAYVLGCIV